MELKDLKNKRISAGLSQQAMANKIGTNRATISLLENGKRKPSFEMMTKISGVFNEPIVIKERN